VEDTRNEKVSIMEVKQVLITGKDVYMASYASLDQERVGEVWEGVLPDIQASYERRAAKLNEQHITPLLYEVELQKEVALALAHRLNAEIATRQLLQALLRDCVEFMQYDAPTVRKWAVQWRAERDALAKRAKTLLGESIK
jgi:hypothetical protein